MLCDQLGVDSDMRDLVSVNGEQVLDLDTALTEGDRVEVFPAVLGGARSVYLDEGLRLYREGDYFMAHETLEEHWAEAPESERDFLQGLIHVCVGLHHRHRGNGKGAALQFRKAVQRLAAYGAEHQGVDLARLREFLAEPEGDPPNL